MWKSALVLRLASCCTTAENLHIRPDIDIAAGHFGCAEENVSAVSTGTIHPDRVLAAVGGGAVQGDFTTLVAVLRVRRPCGLIPSGFEVVRDLTKCERHESKCEEGGLAEHFCGCQHVRSWTAVLLMSVKLRTRLVRHRNQEDANRPRYLFSYRWSNSNSLPPLLQPDRVYRRLPPSAD